MPAAGRRWLNATYDPMLALTMRERRFRTDLIERVLAAAPRTVLDVGCGTGTLAIRLAQCAPGMRVIGLDGDAAILDRAAVKAEAASVELELLHALADDIPLEDASVDCVVCSLVLHHLFPAGKRIALSEMRRVLTPDGRLLVADWGEPQDPLMRLAFFAVRLLDGFSNTREHAAGQLPEIITAAGFRVHSFARLRTAWGSLLTLTADPESVRPAG